MKKNMTLIYGVAAVAAVYFYMEYRKKEEAKSSFNNAGGVLRRNCKGYVAAGQYGSMRECKEDIRPIYNT
tara:strand:+ start:11195 stop:11404 length:210 start_codon:yes stop_codon:yes gene_type:complete